MAIKPNLLMLGAVLCVSASTPGRAQPAGKCGSRVSVTYFQAPCSNPVAMRPRPGETTQQFETRRRKSRSMPQDGAECERLEMRVPVQDAGTIDPGTDELPDAQAALSTSKKRLREPRC